MEPSYYSGIRKLKKYDVLKDTLEDAPTEVLKKVTKVTGLSLTQVAKKLTKVTGLFFNYRETCGDFRAFGLPVPTLETALAFFNKWSGLILINIEADGNIYTLADGYFKKDKIINILYFVFLQIQLLLDFLGIATNEFEETSVETAFESYTFLNLYTGPPGIKHLFSISIPLRRVLFASDIL